ncbi:MAG: 1-deoxy-D-xylulose-5-phosphate reductoisomerase, partial [Patescibacteria group bacterium]|nr:1-deoxy-D-xylulose-5-phosphate reductoisomerase [Patescibacteria group bacterium]
PAVLNAANEEAVTLFLERKIPYTGISELVGKALNKHVFQANSINLDVLLDADRWAREVVKSMV